jgi:hypothetical protein
MDFDMTASQPFPRSYLTAFRLVTCSLAPWAAIAQRPGEGHCADKALHLNLCSLNQLLTWRMLKFESAVIMQCLGRYRRVRCKYVLLYGKTGKKLHRISMF